jgi:uncharacterized membrane protein
VVGNWGERKCKKQEYKETDSIKTFTFLAVVFYITITITLTAHLSEPPTVASSDTTTLAAANQIFLSLTQGVAHIDL